MPLHSKIEAVLFWKSAPMQVKKLAEILEVQTEDITAALTELEKSLEGRGVQLIFKEDEVMLGTRNELGSLIEKLIKDEIVRDLGKAGLETLSIILYRGPVSRRDIDYVRGVQSNFILRNLMIRGLVEKISNPQDERSFLYKPTFELLSYLGIQKIEELPEYGDMQKEMQNYITANEAAEKNNDEGKNNSIPPREDSPADHNTI